MTPHGQYCPPHPLTRLTERQAQLLDASYGVTVSEAARYLRVDRQRVSYILQCWALTPDKSAVRAGLEDWELKDGGCEAHPAGCLSCPYPAHRAPCGLEQEVA